MYRSFRPKAKRRSAVRHYSRTITLVFEEVIKEIAQFGIVLDDQNFTIATNSLNPRFIYASIIPIRRYGPAFGQYEFDAEDRPPAWDRTDIYTMLQQIPQTLYNRQTETKALTTFSRGIVELPIFFEDGVKFLPGDTGSGIANLDAQHSVASTTSEQYPAAHGIF